MWSVSRIRRRRRHKKSEGLDAKVVGCRAEVRTLSARERRAEEQSRLGCGSRPGLYSSFDTWLWLRLIDEVSMKPTYMWVRCSNCSSLC